MRRKGKGSFSTHFIDNAVGRGSDQFRPRSGGGIEQTIPGFNSPKSHELDRAMDSVLTSHPRTGNRTFWNTYYEIQDAIKRRRGNNIR
jgi:hypothetical protein